MPYKVILLDTCAYLWLARSIHPFIGIPFGDEKNALYLHKDIQRELDRSARLQNSFAWVEQEEYKKERKKIIPLSQAQSAQIELSYDYIWQYQKDFAYSLSREDIYCIATAQVLGVPLVSDDSNLLLTAKAFGIKTMMTLELLKLMVDCDFIEREEVEQIVDYLKYSNDFPPSFNKLYRTLFKNPP
jgi:predicted nucleic acid-binding protein